MSHVVSISTIFKDLESLRLTCKELGLTWKENQRTYQWYGYSVGDYPLPPGFKDVDLGKCEHAIGVPDTSWEIGVCRRRNVDGSLAEGYTLIFDFFGRQGRPILKAIGSDDDYSALVKKEQQFGMWNPAAKEAENQCAKVGKFCQRYGILVTEKVSKARGLMVRRVNRPDGVIRLSITGRAL